MDMKKLFFMFVFGMVAMISTAQNTDVYTVKSCMYEADRGRISVMCTNGHEFVGVHSNPREFSLISSMVPGGVYSVTYANEILDVRRIGTEPIYAGTPVYVTGYPQYYGYYGGYYGGEPRHHGKASRTAAKVAAGAAGVAVVAGVLSAILK